jgi:molybdopterin converting factor subunit 1
MRVTVRLFARLRDLAGTSEAHVELPDGATARALWATLVAQHTEFERYGSSVSTAVNEEYAQMDRTLSDGDEVAFLPPVSGG